MGQEVTGSNIKPLFQAIETVTGADLKVVELLRELLDRAERGEIVAIAYATASRDGNSGSGWKSASSSCGYLAMAIMSLNYRYAAAMCEDD